MLKRFQDYIETSDWESFLDDDIRALRIVCWVVIAFAVVWFVPTMVRIVVYGPVQ